MVTGAWKSWVAGGSVGRPPHFAKPLVQYTYGRDWSVLDQCVVSLRMLRHRVHLAYVSSPQGAERLSSAVASSRIGGALLLERRRGWFLNVSVELPSPPSWKPVTPIGVDRGVDYVAVARALGKRPLVCSARTLRHSKTQYVRTRNRLQARDTASAKRVLRRLSGRESRLGVDTNRKAARAVADYAIRFDRPVLVLEELRGVQSRCLPKTRHASEARVALSGWTYNSFLECLLLAAESQGIPVEFVTPAWSSRTCPRCGDARIANRNKSSFRCQYCNYQNHADVVGATNLARRWLHEHAQQPWGPVNGPNERGKDQGEPRTAVTPADVQAPGLPGSVDTPLPTSH